MKKLTSKQDIKTAKSSPYISRRLAARTLGVMPTTLDNLAVVHNLRVRQVPGHNRKHFLRDEIEALAARAEHIATEARA